MRVVYESSVRDEFCHNNDVRGPILRFEAVRDILILEEHMGYSSMDNFSITNYTCGRERKREIREANPSLRYCLIFRRGGFLMRLVAGCNDIITVFGCLTEIQKNHRMIPSNFQFCQR
jgi:hypothetical protein